MHHHALIIAFAATLCTGANAQDASADLQTADETTESIAATDIAETPRSLEDLKADLATCLARTCDPADDIEASLAYAEELFVTGDIRAARAILAETIERNETTAPENPEPMSGLYRASARLAEQLGDLDAAQQDLTRMRDVLRDHDAANIEGRLTTEIELADGMRKAADWMAAEDGYRHALQLALENQHTRMQALATMRLADTLMHAPVDLSIVDADPYKARRARIAEAREILGSLLASPPLNADHLVTKARLMAICVDREAGILTSAAAEAALDGVVAEMAALPPSPTPTLVHQPGIVTGVEPNFTQGVGRPDDKIGGEEDWVDVRYRIDMDGRVTNVETLRSSGAADWPGRVLTAIRGRRYVPPIEPDQFSPGNVRLERITRVFDIEPIPRPGTNVRVRSGRASVRSVDLTPKNEDADDEQSLIVVQSSQ